MQSTATASAPALVDVVAQPMEPRQVQLLLAFVSNDTSTISNLMLFEVLNIFYPVIKKLITNTGSKLTTVGFKISTRIWKSNEIGKD